MGRKLDLSKLTDEEAKHVWEVVQRDFELRKKEDERLEELKGKVEKESTKREILSGQSHLNETHCIHCLQPFRFLVNSKCQCLYCHFYTCKNCSCYNDKEQGWVCDPCRISRIVKTGSLEWYYEHVKSRFKRFGSAKVLRSLYGRMTPGQKIISPASLDLGRGLGLQDRVYSLPNIYSDSLLYSGSDDNEEGKTDDAVDGAEYEGYAKMHKRKRLLSLHTFDFETDSEYSDQSHHLSVPPSPTGDQDGFQTFADAEEEASQKQSMVAEADLAATFHHILQEQGLHSALPEQEFATKVQLTRNSRTQSLERTPRNGRSWSGQHRSQWPADTDTSGDEMEGDQQLFVYKPHPTKHRSRTSSLEYENLPGNQILELNKRMSAVERVLNRLEGRILVYPQETLALESHTDPGIEEEELKRQLEELASNISDTAVSSEEEEGEEERKTNKESQTEMSSSGDDLSIDVNKAHIISTKTSGPGRKQRFLDDQAWQNTTTDSELSELEDKVASAAAQMQRTESQVSEIKSRIAALSAAGLTLKPVEMSKNEFSYQVLTVLQPPKSAYNSPEDQSLDSPVTASPDFKVMSMPHVLRRKFVTSLDVANNADSFGRNSYYRGSLTQRNPNGKNRKADHIFAKPVMAHWS